MVFFILKSADRRSEFRNTNKNEWFTSYKHIIIMITCILVIPIKCLRRGGWGDLGHGRLGTPRIVLDLLDQNSLHHNYHKL